MRSAITLGMGLWIAAAAPGLCAQAANPMTTMAGAKNALADKNQSAKQSDKPAAKPAGQAPAKSASAGAAKPAPQGAKAKTKGGRKGKAGGKPPVKAIEKPATPGAPKAAAESEVKAARRDPFESLINRQQGGGGAKNLPPGKPGLQVSTLRLDGIVRAPNGMIAVVSNPQSRVYFLREGDRLYDGSVEKITMDGVSFHEEGKDAFGKPVERQVNKRIYSTSSGEQQ